MYNAEDDKEGVELQDKVKRSDIAKVVEKITGAAKHMPKL
jgi:hypothetical protein